MLTRIGGHLARLPLPLYASFSSHLSSLSPHTRPRASVIPTRFFCSDAGPKTLRYLSILYSQALF